MNNKIFFYAVIIFLFIFVANSFASLNLVSEKIQTNYSGGDIVKGNISLTFSNQPVSSILTSNFLGNITLIRLLKLHTGLTQGVSYTCNTPDCSANYDIQGETNGFSVSENNDKLAGFVVSGTGVSITDAKFAVQSNALASCLPQIKIDVLVDGTDIMTNYNGNGESCGVRYTGCYNQGNSIEATIISSGEYCEKMTLPASSSFIVGGEIRNGTTNANLTMKLYDSTEGGLAGTCLLPKHTQQFQELSCAINYATSQSRDYYVCITSSNSGGYKIGWETQAPNCGTAQGFDSLNSDFDLFAETTQYSSSPNFVVNETSYDKQFNIELDAILDGYISDKYNRQCEPNPCIIPISFSGNSQYIQLSNAQIDYETVGVPNSVSGLQEISYVDALVSGTNLSLDISKANFSITLTSNENKFKLFVDNNLIMQKDISIKKGFLFDILPKFVAFGQNAQFSIISNKTIASSTWDFGDGTEVQNVNLNKAVHTYTKKEVSIFLLSVTAKDSEGLESTKQFSIAVGDPRILANQTIADYKLRIDNITNQINSQSPWMVQKLQEISKIQDISSRLSVIENKYKIANVEDDYKNVMIDLIGLSMPKEIVILSSGQNIPLSVGYLSVNPAYIETIDNKDVSDNSALVNKIVEWMDSHFSSEISFRKIALVRDFKTEVIATTFSIDTKPSDLNENDIYLIFGQDVENAGAYKTNYGVKSISGIGIDYVQLKPENSENFEFLVLGDISAENLGAYISPQISDLGVESAPTETCNLNNICESDESEDSCPEDCSRKWIRFSIISWMILGVVFIIVYIILQEWYKKRYQKSLFPDENDLYNLINFIYNARRSRLNDKQIFERLKTQGWTHEKVNFAFKKISGKRIGMLEIPLFTHSQHKQILEKISVKQGAPIDARFIKRQSFS